MKGWLHHQLLETRENGYCLHTLRKMPPLSTQAGPARLPGDMGLLPS